jgi:hypothetical protein
MVVPFTFPGIMPTNNRLPATAVYVWNMKLSAMRDWLRPIFGAALLLGGAAVLAYKVINGYRHASPDAFFSVQDQNRLAAAPAADGRSTPSATVPAAVPAPQQVAASVAQTPPIAAAPPPAPESSVGSTPSAAAIPADEQDRSDCAPVKSEQREIRGALNKQYSPEEGRYMQRRLRELSEQLVKLQCAE